jgi:hypothetical protein
MSPHAFDTGRHFWLAAAVLFGVTGALLVPGCSAPDRDGDRYTPPPSGIEREVPIQLG